jgi:carbon monoxide dehydrogenase subunit G
MRLVNEFCVDAPLDVTWAVLTDIPEVIECVPGAELDRQDGDDYHAHVAIKIGPVGMTLAGMATLVSRDDAAREMVVRGTARDRRGNGSTEATVHMIAADDAGRSVVTVTTDLELSGRIAQFGSGVITQVGNRIIGQFVARLNAVIAGDREPARTGGTAAAHTPARPSDQAVSGQVASERIALALTALAGVALGLALGRWADRVSCPPRQG